ncbi:MAG: anti-sigma factor [Nocardioides sp.]|nr:anti-sigma factor [Nocardioides sp.]
MSSDIHALSGAYAVDALDDIERAQFERHLAACDACRSEIESLREASAMLAETAAAGPPAALRDRVLAGIETVRPLPPVVSPLVSAPERRRRRFPALVAAAAVVTLIGIGGAVWQPWADETSQSPSATERVLQAPDAEVLTQELDNGAVVTLTRSKELNQAVLTTEDMPAPDSGTVYEVWLQHDELMVPAGLMDEAGSATVLLEGDPATANGAGITVEPAGGSDEPTGEVVTLFEFEQV